MTNCTRHPNRPAIETCRACHSLICDECGITLGEGVYCRTCIEAKMRQEPPTPLSTNYASGQRSRFLAFILSFLPGVGYLYLGLMRRGLQTLILFFGSIFLSDFVGLDGLNAVVIPVLIFFSVFDTQQLARRMNQGEIVEDKDIFVAEWFKMDYKWVGYGLIALGLLGLLNNLSPMLFPSHLMKVVFAPLAIIGLGVYILYKNTKGSDRRF